METVRTNDQGYVIGFDRLNIDPMATKRRVLADEGLQELQTAIATAQEAVKRETHVVPNPDGGSTVHCTADYGPRVAAHSEAVAAHAAEYQRLTKALVMYFQPRRGEVVLPPDELAGLKAAWAALKPGQKLTLKGEVIDVTEDG
jgi:hypothetical protein